MNEYELEYYVSTEEIKNRYIDEKTLNKVRKVRSKILRKALFIYLIALIAFIFIIFHILLRIPQKTFSLVITIAIVILIIALQRLCVDKLYKILIKRKYKKHLSHEFIERMKNEHRYYED